MTLTIDISPEMEARLKDQAQRRGLDEKAYALQVIEDNLAAASNVHPEQATLDLLAKWRAEGEASTPEEIALGQKEWEEFRDAMNEDSLSGRPIYP